MTIIETFEIAGRGLTVAVATTSALPAGQKLLAVVTRPDGSTISTNAHKELLLRRRPGPVEVEGFLLIGVSRADVPIGSDLQLKAPCQ